MAGEHQRRRGWAGRKSIRQPGPSQRRTSTQTGHYRAEARDTPITDEKGESRITVGDYANAVIDTLENESFIHARFTVAY